MIPRTSTKSEGFFIKQYLATLALQAKINKKTDDAINYYITTQEQPDGVASMPDNRSITEKYSDLETQKIEINSELLSSGITDGSNANTIVGACSPNELTFLANHITYIIDELKPQYKLGVPAPIFMAFLKELIKRQNDEPTEDDKEQEKGEEKEQEQEETEKFVFKYISPFGTEHYKVPNRKVLFQYLKDLYTINGIRMDRDIAYNNKLKIGAIKEFLKENDVEIKKSFNHKAGGKGLSGGKIITTKKPENIVLTIDDATSSCKSQSFGVSRKCFEETTHIPFGKHLINKKQLRKNILSISRHTGNLISPAKLVGGHFAKVIKDIAENNQPTFEDFQILTKEEQKYLYNICEKCNILDKLNVPSPDKTDDEKQSNQFEVMRGEIIAGNTSVELVKNFKILLLKMSNENKLPKTQVRELLLDLGSMGY